MRFVIQATEDIPVKGTEEWHYLHVLWLHLPSSTSSVRGVILNNLKQTSTCAFQNI